MHRCTLADPSTSVQPSPSVRVVFRRRQIGSSSPHQNFLLRFLFFLLNFLGLRLYIVTLLNYSFPAPIGRGQRMRWSLRVGGGSYEGERTFCASEMQHWSPPAEHKQPAEWLVGPCSRQVLIGFCVSQEVG